MLAPIIMGAAPSPLLVFTLLCELVVNLISMDDGTTTPHAAEAPAPFDAAGWWANRSAHEQRLCAPGGRVPAVGVHLAGLRSGAAAESPRGGPSLSRGGVSRGGIRHTP